MLDSSHGCVSTARVRSRTVAWAVTSIVSVLCLSQWAFFGGEPQFDAKMAQKLVENTIEEKYEVYHSQLNQWVSWQAPRVPKSQKAHLGHWTFSRDRCVVSEDTFLTLGMRVPKAASSTLQDLVELLSATNRFAMSRVVQRHEGERNNRDSEEARLVAYLSNLPRRTVHTAHLPFLNFEAQGMPRPIYFATIRDPFRRLSSHYDYVHFGPRPLVVKLLHQRTQVETFEACLHAHMAGKRKSPSHFDCLQTAGLQIRYFCGISNFCRYPSAATLQQALANIEAHFAAVVVVEEMMLSFRVLEAALPSLFRGLAKSYQHAPMPSPGAILDGSASFSSSSRGGGSRSSGQELHARTNSAAKASGGTLKDPRAKKFVLSTPGMQLEYQLYNFTVARLHDQAHACRIGR